MKMTIESTDSIIIAYGVPGRVWKGVTEKGTPVACLIPVIEVPADADRSEMDLDLMEIQHIVEKVERKDS